MQHARSLSLVCALYAAGCAFEPALLTGGPALSPGPDAARPVIELDAGAADARPADAALPADVFCDAGDAALVGCFRFEDTVDDGSGAALDVSESGAIFDLGMHGRALVITAGSTLHVAETAALDVGAFTIEMWVRPDALPTGSARAGLFDNDGQYSVFILDDATVRCSGSGEARQSGVLAIGTWTHVACVHDGDEITLYIDGQDRVTGSVNAPSSGSGNGSNIGGNSPDGGDEFLGRIDELRIWNRARTAGEVCAAAGCVAE
jgi:hypothetical protein